MSAETLVSVPSSEKLPPMIEVNLLPLEKRKKEQTRFARFLPVLIPLVLFIIGTSVAAYHYFAIQSTERKIGGKQQEFNGMTGQVKRHDNLVAEITQISKRIQEILQVKTSYASVWSDVLDEIWSVIQKNDKVWLEDLKLVDGRSAQGDLKQFTPDEKRVPLFAIALKCRLAGSDLKYMEDLRDDFRNNARLRQLFKVMNPNPDYSVRKEEDYEEKASLGFTITLYAF